MCESQDLYSVKYQGSIRNVPEHLITEKMCFECIRSTVFDLQYIPKKFYTPKLLEEAVNIYGMVLKIIPDEYKTKKLCEDACHNSMDALQFTPRKFIDEKLCIDCVTIWGPTLQYVPKELITKEMCRIAVNATEDALDYITLKFVPLEFMDDQMRMDAIKTNVQSFLVIDNKYITKEMLEYIGIRINLCDKDIVKKYNELKNIL